MEREGHLPLLVLVSGPLAAGKTTLAGRLAAALQLPMLSRDAIKDGLAESRGVADAVRGHELAGPTFALFYGTIGRFLAAGCSLVAEHAFVRGVSEQDLRPLVGRAGAVLVHCRMPRAENVRRAEARLWEGRRHGCHPDASIVEQMRAGTFAWDRFQPLDLGIPVLEVDTSRGCPSDVLALAGRVRSAARMERGNHL